MTEVKSRAGAGVWLRRLALVALGWMLGFGTLAAYGMRPSSPELTARVDGAAVSKHGGARIVMGGDGGSNWTQTCNGICDSVEFDIQSADELYELTIVDASGQCVLCEKGEYLTSGMTVVWSVGDGPQLTNRRNVAE